MQNMDNSVGRGQSAGGQPAGGRSRRGVLHLGFQHGTSGFRVMAQLEDGAAVLMKLADSYAALRAAGEEAAREVDAERDRYRRAFDNGGISPQELAALRPAVVSIYTEHWEGKMTSGGWQTLAKRDGGFYRAFRPQPQPAAARTNGRHASQDSRHRSETRQALRGK